MCSCRWLRVQTPKYTHQTYGTGVTTALVKADADDLLDKMTKALAQSMKFTKETIAAGVFAQTQATYSLTNKGKLQLVARAEHTDGGLCLIVYSLVTDDTVKSKSVRQWEVVEEHMFVPVTTTHSEQDRIMRFMCDIVSTRVGIDYMLRQAPSTRKPKKER